MWQYNGNQRPPFADVPGAGQESVWDYPRPPRSEATARTVTITAGAVLLAESKTTIRVLETASPPTYYLPPNTVVDGVLVPVVGRSVCEWKGAATYLALALNPSEPVGWRYSNPTPAFDALADYVSFYPGRVACWLDGERVQPQPGGFYGGWLTADIVGPVKGEPGTGHW